MLPYLIFFAILAIGALVAATRPPGANARALLPMALLVAVMIGLRREVGGDWYNYLGILNDIRIADVGRGLSRTEPAYAFLNWIAARAGWGIWFPNLVCAAIFTWGLAALARRQPNPMLALVAASYMIVLVGMGYTRQSAALGLVMLALTQYLRGATWRMLLSLAAATLFHSSALIVVPLIGLAAMRQRAGTFIVAVILGLALYYQMSARIAEITFEYGRGGYNATGALPRLLLNAIPAAIFLAFRQRFAVSPAERRLLSVFALSSFGALALLYFVSSSLIADRLVLYLSPLQIVILARLPSALGTSLRPSLPVTILVIAYSITIAVGWLQFGRWGSAWLPYRSYVWDWSEPRPREGLRSRY